MSKSIDLLAIGISAGANGIPTFSANGSLLNNIIDLVYTAIGALALFYIVRAALLFVTGSDNPNDIKQAKMTILIAVASFFIASVAFAIVNFVIANVGGTN